MDVMPSDRPALEPLHYHRQLVAYLKQHEPEVWRWAASQRIRDEHIAQVRSDLLRDTYRLEAEAHPEVHASLQLAMQRLGMQAPATLYQAGSQDMNAALVFVPGEVHMVLQGPLLERLSDDERLALFGHELAHYVLWSLDGGDFHVADRILNDALASPQASPSQAETLRRYALHTELFADRGGAVAAAAPGPAVSTLLKVQTGVANPDPVAYLRQAAEVDANEKEGSSMRTHPETFIRARALEQWWQRTDRLDGWVRDKLCGALSLEALDLLDQQALQQITRGFLGHFLDEVPLRSALVLNQVRQLFPDWNPGEATVAPQAIVERNVDDSVRGYLNALMLDLALVDPDVQDAALLRASTLAHALGSAQALQANLKRDARLGKRELDKLKKNTERALSA